MGYRPAVACVVFVVVGFGPARLGYPRAPAWTLVTGLGVLGLTGLVLADGPSCREPNRLGQMLDGFKLAGAAA